MSANSQARVQYKPVKTILVSQPKPERSPYYDLEKKYDLQIDWRPFIHVEAVDHKEFRKFKMSADTKYFCLSPAIANYLQKFIIYRKRKVFVGKKSIEDLKPLLQKHKEKESFLLPCSNLGSKDVSSFLEAENFDWKDALMYRTVSSDLSDLSDVTYDVLVFFSPLGIKSLYENFPDFKQNETRLAVYGKSTEQAVLERGLTVNIHAPAPNIPSMPMALERYLQESNNS